MVEGATSLMDQWEGQQIVDIPIDSLVLWSENPRDPISGEVDNFAIIENALHGAKSSTDWKLGDLAANMGNTYDCSELPTVVYNEKLDKYIVFDGNRRIALALIERYGLPGLEVQLPLFPREKIPCNVCDRRTAIEHVFRKHGESGSWGVYERDVFASRYMDEPKSVLVRLEELIGAISKYPQLNQVYVRDDVLNVKHLREFGLNPDAVDYGVPPDVLEDFVREIALAIDRKLINTRGGRNNPLDHIDSSILERIEESKTGYGNAKSEELPFEESRSLRESNGKIKTSCETASKGKSGKSHKRTRTVKSKSPQVFGGILRLRPGDTNNLYRALDELWRQYEGGRIVSHEAFPGIFRAGLRLLVECAAQEKCQGKKALDEYIESCGNTAWSALRNESAGNEMVTYLSSNSVTKDKLHSLLHTGAHCYSSSGNREQALALSVYVGAMLTISHGR